MFLSSWRKLVQQVKRNAGGARRKSALATEARKSTPLWVELLEDRTLLSAASIYQWTGGSLSGTNWNDSANWMLLSGPGNVNSYPNAVGDVAKFTGSPSSSTVTLASAITVGEVDFGTASSISISATGGNVLTLDNTGFASASIISTLSANSGTDNIFAPLTVANTKLAATISAGTLQLNNTGAQSNTIGATSNFTINNGGVLDVTGPANTGSAGITVGNGGSLDVTNGGTLASTPTVTVLSGGNLTVTDTTGSGGHFGATTNLVMDGGTFSYIGISNAASNDTLGTISLTGGNSLIASNPTGTGSVTLTSAQLVRSAGATVTFSGTGLGSTSNEILFTTAPAQIGNSAHIGIGALPYASVNGTDFATYQVNNANDPTITGIGAFNDYAPSISKALPGDIVDEANSEALTANTQIAGLLLAPGGSVLQAGKTFTIGSSTLTGGGANTTLGGEILNSNALGSTVTGGTLAIAGSGEGVVLNAPQAGQISANFFNTPNISDQGYNSFGGQPLGAFGQFNFNNTLPSGQRVDPDINYPLSTAGLSGAGGPGQPAVPLPNGVSVQNGLTAANSLAVQWSGYLNVIQGGVYTIITMAGSTTDKLYIDGQLATFGSWRSNLINGPLAAVQPATGQGGGYAGGTNDNIGNNSYTTSLDGNVYAVTLTLTPGLHSILADLITNTSTSAGDGLVLGYQGPDTANQAIVIPATTSLTSPGFEAAGVLTLSSLITGSTSLTLAGGQVNLPTANSYTGATYLSGAVANIGSPQALGGTGSTLNINSSATIETYASLSLTNPFALNNATVTFTGSNNLTLSGTGALTGTNTLVLDSEAQTILSGAIAGTGSLVVTQLGTALTNRIEDSGALTFNGTGSTFSGGTTLQAGSLMVAASSTSVSGSITKGPLGVGTLTLSGGTVYADDQAETLGNQVVLNGNVTIAPSSSELGGGLVNSSTNSALLFTGSATILSNTTLNMSGTATFSGAMGGTGQLTETGLGTLTLSGTSNYSGGTVLSAGSLGAFGTLVVGNNSALGSGPLNIISGALLAASSPNNTVPVVLPNSLVLGNNSFVAFGGTTGTASAPITFTNSNTFPNGNTITGTANLIVDAPTIFNMTLTDGTSPGSLVLFSGTSTLTVTGTASYSGTTLINGGTLALSGGGQLSGSTSYTINVGGTLTVNDSAGNGPGGATRLNSGASLQLNGGTFNFVGLSGGSSSESFGGGIVLISGQSTVITNATGVGGTVTLDGNSLARSQGATINFVATSTGQASPALLGGVDQVTLAFVSLVNGIVPYATVTDGTSFATNTTGYNFATFNGTGVAALTTYATTASLTGGAGDATLNVLATSSYNFAFAAGSDTVNSLLLIGDNVNVSGATAPTPFNLTVASGAVASNDPVAVNAVGNTVSVPTLTFGSAEGLVFTGQGSDTISSHIHGSGGLTIGGTGTLTLPSVNSYTSTSGQAEVQTINATTGSPTGGTFTLTFDGQTTGAISYTAPATGVGSVQTALQGLAAIGAGNVTVTQSGGTFTPYTVTFGAGLAGQLLPLITANLSLQGGTTPLPSAFVTFGASSTAVNSGTLILGSSGAIQGGITFIGGTVIASSSVSFPNVVSFGAESNTYGPSSSNVTFGGSGGIALSSGIILNGLSTIVNDTDTGPLVFSGAVSSITQTGINTTLIKTGTGRLSMLGTNTSVGAFLVEQGIVDDELYTALGTSGFLTQPATTLAPVAGNQVQTFNITGTFTGGSFTISVGGATSGPIPWVQGQSTVLGYVQGALDTMTTVGLGNSVVSEIGTITFSTTGTNNSIIFQVVFQNQLANTNLPQISVNVSGLTGLAGFTAAVTNAIPTPAVPSAAVFIGTTGLAATVQITSSSLGGLGYIFYPQNFVIAGNGVVTGAFPNGEGAINTFAGNNALEGAITLYKAASVGGSYPLPLMGGISGGGDLTKVGSSVLYLTGPNTFTGGLNILSGIAENGLQESPNGNMVHIFPSGYATEFGMNVSGISVSSGASFGLGNGAIITGKALTIAGNGYGFQQQNTEVNPLGAFVALQYSQGATWSGDITLVGSTSIAASNIIYSNAMATVVVGGATGINTVFPFIITGVIGGTGSLTKYGSAPLDLWAPSTYSGTTTVGFGQLTLAQSGTLASSTVNVTPGTTFTMDDTISVVPSRFTGGLLLNGGTFSFLPSGVAGATSTVNLGTITLVSGNSTISVGTGAGASATIVNATALVRQVGATVNFSSTILGQSNNLFLLTNAPVLTNSILPYATVSAGGSLLNWVTFAAPVGGAPVSLAPFNNYLTNLSSATSTSNVLLTSSVTISSNITVNSLVIAGSATITISSGGTNFNLNIGSGGIIAGATTTLNGGTLNFGTAEGILLGGGNMNINSVIAGSNGVTDSNTGTVTLGTAGGNGNTYTAPASPAGAPGTTLNAGILLSTTVSSLSSGPLSIVGGGFGVTTSGLAIGNTIQFNNSVAQLAPNLTAFTLVGPMTLAGLNQITAGSATGSAVVNLAGIITDAPSGPGELSLVAGNLQIDNSLNTYSGGTLLGGTAGGGGGYFAEAATTLQPEASDNALNEIQKLTFPAATGGTFTLAFAGQTTGPITYSTVTATLQKNIQNSLNVLSQIANAVNAVQTINFSGGPTTGTFSLTFSGQTASGITFSTNAATLATNIQTALAGLTNVGAGNVAVSSSNTNTVTVVFQNSLGAAAQPTMTIGGLAGLTGSSSTLNSFVATTTAGVAATVTAISVTATSATTVNLTFQNTLGGTSEPVGVVTNPSFAFQPTATQIVFSETQKGGVVTGPLGTGTFYWFGNSINPGFIGTSGGSAVAIYNGNPLIVANVVLHNPVAIINANVSMTGVQFNTGGNLTLAGPITMSGNSTIAPGSNVTLTFAGQISGDGSCMDDATTGSQGQLYFTGNNVNWSGGGMIYAQNTIKYGNSNGLGTGPWTIPGGMITDDGLGGAAGYNLSNPMIVDSFGGQAAKYNFQSASSPVTFSGLISGIVTAINGGSGTGAGFPFTKTGLGTLIIANLDVAQNSIVIDDGTVIVSGSGAITQAKGGNFVDNGIAINPGATLILDNSVVNSGDRIADAIPINLRGGTLKLVANNAPNTVTSENLGQLNVDQGEGQVISTVGTGAGDSTVLTFASMVRLPDFNNITYPAGAQGNTAIIEGANEIPVPISGSLLNLVGVNGNIGSATNQIIVTGAITAVNGAAGLTSTTVPLAPGTSGVVQVNNYVGGVLQATPGFILPFAAVTGTSAGATTLDIASPTPAISTSPNSGPYSLGAFTGYETGGISTSTSPQDVVLVQSSDPSGNDSVPFGQTVAALDILGDGITVGSNSGGTLTVNTGAIFSSPGSAVTTLGNTIAANLSLPPYVDSVTSAAYTGEGYIFNNSGTTGAGGVPSGGLTFSGNITATSPVGVGGTNFGGSGITLGGTGVDILSGSNSLTGYSNLDSGTLVDANPTPATGAVAGIIGTTTYSLAVYGGSIESGLLGGVNFSNPINLDMFWSNDGLVGNNGGNAGLGATTQTNGVNAFYNSSIVGNQYAWLNPGTDLNITGADPITFSGPIGAFGPQTGTSASAAEIGETGGVAINLATPTTTVTFGGATANAYFGDTFVNTGTLIFAKTAAGTAAVTSPVFVGSGGTIQQTALSNQFGGINVTLTGTASIVLGTTQATIQNLTFNNGGTINMATGATVATGGSLLFSGNILVQDNNGTTSSILGGALEPSAAATKIFNVNNGQVISTSLSSPIQTLSFTGTPTGGNFTLTFNGATTGNIAFSTTSSTLVNNISAALALLTTISGAGGVTVAAAGTNTVTVTFNNATAATAVPQITSNIAAAGTVQTINFPGTPAGGTFTLNYNGQTTAPITYTTTAALATNIQGALNNLQVLGATNGVTQLLFSGTPTGGTFTLQVNGIPTAAIPYSATASILQANIVNALSAISSVYTVNGAVTNTVNVAVGGTAAAATVTFQNALGGANSPTLTVGSSSLTGTGSPAVTTGTATAGTSATGAGIVANVAFVSSTSVTVAFQGNTLGAGAVPVVIVGNGLVSNAQQQVTFPANASSGTFELTYNGQTTAPISFSATATTLASNIQGALGALTNVNGTANISVTASGLPLVATVTFVGALAGTNPSLMLVPIAINAVQTVTFPGAPASGTFTLSYNNGTTTATTAPITYTTTSALGTNIQTALNTLSTLGATNSVQTINFTGSPTGGSFTLALNGGSPSGPIAFGPNLTPNIQNALTGLTAASGLNTTNFTVTPFGPNAVQTLTFGGTITSGSTASTFTLTYNGQTTAAIQYNSVAATLQTNIQNALTALGFIGSGNVAVVATGGPSASATITFQNALGGVAQSTMTVASNLTGTSPTVSNATTTPGGFNAVQTLVFGGTINSASTASTFTLTLNGQTTAAIQYNSVAATLQTNILTALNALLGVGAGNVAVATAGSPTTTATITFQNGLGFVPINTMTVASSLSGTSPSVALIAAPTGNVSGVTVAFQNALGGSVETLSAVGSLTGGVTPGVNVANTTTGASFSGNTQVTFNSATSVSVTFIGADATTTVLTLGSTGLSANSVQTLSFGGVTGGNFSLTLGALTTAPISFQSSVPSSLASSIQSALAALTGVGSGNVSVTASGTPIVAIVTFQGTLAGHAEPTLVVNTSPTNAVQNLNFSAATTGGAFTLTTGGQTTGAISYSAVATTLQQNISTALNALSSLGATNAQETINITGNPTGGSFKLTFGGITTPAIAFSTTASTLQSNIQAGLNALQALGATNAVQTVYFGGVPTVGNTFTLNFNGQTTAAIAYSNVATTLQQNISTALTALSGIGAGNVLVGGTATAVTVTFQNSLGGAAQPLMTASGSLLTGTTPSVAVGPTTTGAPSAFSPVTVAATTNGNVLVTFQNRFGGAPQGAIGTASIALTGGSSPTVTVTTNTTVGAPASPSNVVVGGTATNVTLTFQNNYAGGVVLSLVSAGTSLTGTTSSGVNAVQSLTFTGGPTTGSFSLTFAGVSTQPIAYSTTATLLQSNIQSALNALPTIGAGNALVTAVNGTSVNITFQNALGLSPQPLIGTSVASINAVQTLNITGSPTGGTFTLTYNGVASTPITYSSITGVLQAGIQFALDGLSTLGGFGNTIAIVNAAATSANITFVNGLAGQLVLPLSATNVALTGGSTPGAAVVTLINGQGQVGGITALTTTAGVLPSALPIVVTSLTTGFGLTGTSPTITPASVVTGATGGLAGGTNQTVTVTAATVGLGLNGGQAPTVGPAATGGSGGLTGGANQNVSASTTGVGTGLLGSSLGFTGSLTPGFFGDLVVTSVVSNNGGNVLTVVKSGNGTLEFSGSATNTYSGTTSVDSGTLLLNMQASVNAYSGPLVINGFAGSDALKVISGFSQLFNGAATTVNGALATLDITTLASGAANAIGQTIGALNINGGTVKLGSNTLTLTGTLTGLPSGGQSATITNTSSAGSLVLPTTQTIASADVSGVPGLNISAVISGAGGINKQGTGTVILSSSLASNSYTGVTTVNEGKLALAALLNTVTFTGTPTGGTFTLTVNGVTSGSITYSSVLSTLEANVTSALNLSLGAGNFAFGSTATATAMTIAFQNALALTPIPTAANTGLLPAAANVSNVVTTRTAVPAATGQTVSLIVGDGAGGSGTSKSDVVQLEGAAQIATGVGIIVNNSGLLDLNGFAQTINGATGGNALTVVGGSVTTGAGTLTIGGPIAGQNNAANVTPATISGLLALSATQIIDVLAAGAGSSLTGPDMVISAVISGASGVGLTKTDTGVLQLLAANTYPGPTTVNGGTLLVDGSLLSTGTVAVSGSGVLGGTGSTGGVIVSTGGTLNPGDPVSSKGIFTVSSPIGSEATTDLSNGGNLTLEVSAYATPGTSYDQLNLTGLGILRLGNTSTLTLDLAGLTTDNTATSVITFVGLEGKFTTVTTINNSLFGFVPVVTYLANAINISFAGPATHFSITSATSPLTAGVASNLTVTALDQLGNTAISYTGTVNFTKSDNNGQVVIPGSYTFVPGDDGVHIFPNGVKLITAGTQTITATDSSSGTITGSGLFTVVPNVATKFQVIAPGTVVAGQFLVLQVTAQDQYGNTVTAYGGTVHFTSTDSIAVLSNDSTLNAGTGSFAALLETAGPQTVTATDITTGQPYSGISGISNPTTIVAPAALNHFGVVAPVSAAPGTAFTVTVVAEDKFNNTVTGYTGTVQFSPATGGGVVVPANYTFVPGDHGVHVFTNGVTLVTSGIQTITVSDTVTSSLTGSTTITLSPSTVAKFKITTPGSTAAGFPFPVGVTAVDQFGNQVTSYTGTVHFTSSDNNASLPADSGLSSSGATFFGALLRTAGNDTITVTDSSLAISSTSSPITVSNIAISQFAVATPANTVAGTPVPFTVTAQDQFKNTVAGYTGTVHFSSSDALIAAGSGLPSNYTFTAGDNGLHVFSVTFKTPGKQTVTATDTTTSTITGTSNSSSVASLAVTSVTNDASSFTVNFNEPFVPADVNLYDLPVPGGPLGPTDVTLTGGGSGSTNGPVSFHGSLILNSTNTGFTFVKTSSFNGQSFAPVTGAFAAGTYTVTLRSAANGFHDSLGNLLSDINGVVGNNFVTTFVVTGAPAVVGIPSFARGPGNSVILPNNAVSSSNGSNQGIPINLSTITAAEAITSGSFTLVYNPALLTITGAAGVTLTGGQVVTLNAVVNTPGTAVITFTSSAALPSSSAAVGVRLGVLLANVPNGAAASYASKAELSFTSESLNGGAVTITGDDAVEVVAYFGDANGDGTLSGGDAALISQVANTSPLNGTLPGFTAFRLADPVILGDLNTNGSVDAPDVTLINSFLSGTTRTQIPTVNPNNLTITHLGPDPVLSVPTNLVGSVGSTVVVPVDIDTARPVGSTGMTEAILALEYNPKVFSVTPADVQLGSLTSGWQLETVVNAQTGQIGIDLFSLTPIQTTSGGSLVNISLHVRDSAPVGSTGLSIVNQVNPSGQRAFQTTVSDSQGALVLHTAMTPAGQEPGSPGLVTIADHTAAIGQDAFYVAPVAAISGLASTSAAPSDVNGIMANANALPLGLVEQVFGDLAQENMLGQPAAILNSEFNGQAETGATDQSMLQQMGVAQHDWVPADMVAYLGQTAKAGHRSPIGDMLDASVSEQDELAGVEGFFAREAAERGA